MEEREVRVLEGSREVLRAGVDEVPAQVGAPVPGGGVRGQRGELAQELRLPRVEPVLPRAERVEVGVPVESGRLRAQIGAGARVVHTVRVPLVHPGH